MEKLKSWKIVNYIDVNVLFHQKKPRCLIGQTKASCPESLVSRGMPHLEKGGTTFYILHWLEKHNASIQEQDILLRQAASFWEGQLAEKIKSQSVA